MLITENSLGAMRVLIVDPNGNTVRKVKTFDTETKEAEIYVTLDIGSPDIKTKKHSKVATYWEEGTPKVPYLLGKSEGQPGAKLKIVTAMVALLGYKAIDRFSGKEITGEEDLERMSKPFVIKCTEKELKQLVYERKIDWIENPFEAFMDVNKDGFICVDMNFMTYGNSDFFDRHYGVEKYHQAPYEEYTKAYNTYNKKES